MFENHRKSLILSEKKSLKNGLFWRAFDNLKLVVNVIRTKNWLKGSNATFWVIFKHCVLVGIAF